MRIFVILLSLQLVWSAHDDFRLKSKKRSVAYDVERYYENLSSVIEFSPNFRWKHTARNFNYSDYRSHKYLNKNFLPFQYDNSYYRGMQKKSPELHKLRPNPPFTRTLRIETPFCDSLCRKMKYNNPFIFDNLEKN